MKFGRALLAVTTLVLGSAAMPTAGHAINITYDFTKSGTANFGDLAAPGYGSVTVTTVGSDLKFSLNLAPNWFVDTGNATVHHPVAFNLATSGLTISGSSGAVTALAAPFIGVNAGGYTNPNFGGPFNYAINCPANGAGGCNNISSLTFYVLGAGLLSPILTNGVYVTADIYNSSVTGGNTGTVGATIAAVPSPFVGAGLPGLIAACAGLLAFARRRRQKFA
jgi:hypothetical protein